MTAAQALQDEFSRLVMTSDAKSFGELRQKFDRAMSLAATCLDELHYVPPGTHSRAFGLAPREVPAAHAACGG